MPYEAEGESFMRKRLLSITLVLLTLMTILLPAPMGVVREAEAESSTSGVEAKIKAVQAQLKKDFPTGFFTRARTPNVLFQRVGHAWALQNMFFTKYSAM